MKSETDLPPESWFSKKLSMSGLSRSQQHTLRQLVEELKTPGLEHSRRDEILDIILGADLVPFPEAIDKLQSLPWRAMREPIIAFLRNEVGLGSVWLYRAQPQGDDQLIERLSGIDPHPLDFSTKGGG